jgi:hypothetical protein
MTPFVKDLALHVRTVEGKTSSVQAPPDLKLGKFLDDLRSPLHLRSNVRWQVCDREGRRLDHNRTLSENGLREGDEIEVREEKEPDPIVAGPSHEPSPGHEPSRSSEGSGNVLRRCDNAHYYDPKKYRECPYCEVRKRK